MPSASEIKSALKKLKNGKSSSDVPPEMLKAASESEVFLTQLKKLIDEIWNCKKVPTDWGIGKLEALWKGKGRRGNASSYRGLNVGSCMCKVIISIILERLNPWYTKQLTDHQNGFRDSRSTSDAICITKRCQQICDRKMEPLYLIFVDLTAAFDHVVRKWLWRSIKMRFAKDENTILIDILESLYNQTNNWIAGSPELNFMTTAGVRQGGPESPPLFCLYLDFVMRIFIDKCKTDPIIQFFKHQFMIPSNATDNSNLNSNLKDNMTEKELPWCGYADDIVLYLTSNCGLQNSIKKLDETFNNFYLKINVGKTKSMVAKYKYLQTNTLYSKSIATLKGEKVENNQEFRYLGAQLHEDQPATGDLEIFNRIESAKCKFASLKYLLVNYDIALGTRLKFLNAYVRSRLTYSAQNWSITKLQTNRIDVTYRHFLRKMVNRGFKRKKEDGIMTFKMYYSNEDILRICKTTDASTFIKSLQKKYLAHTIRRPDDDAAKQLVFNRDKYRKRGRPVPTLLSQVLNDTGMSEQTFFRKARNREF